MQQVICDVPFRDEFIVRWRFQLRKNHSAVSTFVGRAARKFLWTKTLRRRGQRKVRLSEIRPTLVTLFHLYPVGATKIAYFRAYPSTLKITVKIAELRFETAAAHSFVGVLPLPLIFDLPEDSKPSAKKVTRAILSRNQSPGVSNLQRGRS